ncbi:MAG: tripartite tricarboxylate transporter substrate binding protein [Proteobacteria bacterium]|nr:tripartite tricarboxylate transporter substrate binding protein [Pseudomonadota bacterium]
MKHIRTLIALTPLACAAACQAQAAFPSRPITMVVAAPAGGATDAVGRSLADEMSKKLGQPVVIDNKPGASSMLGTSTVARAQPDGYTILLTLSASIMNAQFMYTKMAYDVKRDLAFVSQIASASMVMAVNKDVPARNMKEFLAWSQQNKGKVSYGSFGVGTTGHLISAYLSNSRNLDMTHVAYKGEAPMIQDLIGGQVPWGIGSVGTLSPYLADGRLRALAVAGDARMKELPDVPTMAEAGLTGPEFKPTGWIVMMAPAHTPAPILERIEKEVRAATQAPQVKARFQFYGLTAMGTSAEEFRRDYDATLPVIQRLIKTAGVTAE